MVADEGIQSDATEKEKECSCRNNRGGGGGGWRGQAREGAIVLPTCQPWLRLLLLLLLPLLGPIRLRLSHRSTSELLSECTCDPVPDCARADGVPARAASLWRMLERSPGGNVTQPSLISIFGSRLHILHFSIKRLKKERTKRPTVTTQSDPCDVMSKKILFSVCWQEVEKIHAEIYPISHFSTSLLHLQQHLLHLYYLQHC